MIKNEYARGFAAGKKSIIEQAKDIINNDVAGIYSALFIILFDEFDFDADKCMELACKTLAYWDEHAGDPRNMIALCEEKTGIDVMQKMDWSSDDL